MCDLWRNTLLETLPIGAIPAQIDHALARLGAARQIKLYNSGSFFDRKAIAVEDYPAIAARLDSFEQVIVESHPALLGEGCLRFRDLLKGRLEVAMGLETAHSEILARLNKRMTLEQFSTAAGWLEKNGIGLRVFILVKPPFMSELDSLYWAQRSLDFAFDCGASVASLIPTRSGNGAMDELAANGEFAPPAMETFEAATAYGISLKRGRVFADLWDLERISVCNSCYNQRRNRLKEMNLRQKLEPRVDCADCGAK
jgi:radical SAM enzyme (TIGR01210 family)